MTPEHKGEKCNCVPVSKEILDTYACPVHSPSDTQKTEGWEEELKVKMLTFKYNRQKENGYRLTHEDYMEFFVEFLRTQIALAKERGEDKTRVTFMNMSPSIGETQRRIYNTAIDECVNMVNKYNNSSRIAVEEALLALKKEI